MGRRALTGIGAHVKYRGGVEILLWLVPPLVVTTLTALWVNRVAARAGQPDRDELIERLGRAISQESPRRYVAPAPEPDRSTGVAVRPSRRAS